MIEQAIEKITAVPRGRIPDPIDSAHAADESSRTLAALLNTLFAHLREINEFIVPLSKGRLNGIALPSAQNLLGSPFKELHASLLHLTRQAGQVARGDDGQSVDFMGDFSEAFNSYSAHAEDRGAGGESFPSAPAARRSGPRGRARAGRAGCRSRPT